MHKTMNRMRSRVDGQLHARSLVLKNSVACAARPRSHRIAAPRDGRGPAVVRPDQRPGARVDAQGDFLKPVNEALSALEDEEPRVIVSDKGRLNLVDIVRREGEQAETQSTDAKTSPGQARRS